MSLPRVEIQRDSSKDTKHLIEALEKSCTLPKDGKCYRRTFAVDDSDKEVINWKFKEFDFARKSVTLPIQARGLFTKRDRIVVRGYDKFFNVNETEDTKMENLKKLAGPFVLTLKENGCIIFISGLEDGELLVCSKNSTGPSEESTRNHAHAGKAWLEKQLASVHRTSKELATFLYNNNMVAVAEYCDDEFEEHVLQYTKDKAGLYLHGINFNTRVFKTLPMDYVSEFAKAWGFHEIEYFTLDKISETLKFLSECEKTGTYKDREVEGFVVRCKKDDRDFFFKYKFEEPYLLYRQMREATKKLLAGKKSISEIAVSTRKRTGIMYKYLHFVEDIFQKDEEKKKNYSNSKGIIEMRKLFFSSIGLDKVNVDDLDNLNEEVQTISPDTYKYVLIPVGTIGTGKTTVFLTLSKLYGWPHVQNDNITKRSAKNSLITSCLEALKSSDVVLLDRNNHQHRERKDLVDGFRDNRTKFLPMSTELRLIALNFVDDSISNDALWDITHERIEKRGDNHQSIKYITNPKLFDNVMKGFINRFEAFKIDQEPDSGFDLAINLKLGKNSSLENTKKILNTLQNTYPEVIQQVAEEEVIEAKFKEALEYKPEVEKTFPGRKEKSFRVNYFGVEIKDRDVLVDIVDKVMAKDDTWEQLKQSNRVQSKLHVTLCHSSAMRGKSYLKGEWNKAIEILGIKPTTQMNLRKQLDFYCDLQLNFLASSEGELICVKAEALGIYDEQDTPVSVPIFNKFLHITLGTTVQDIRPVESNKVLDLLHSGVADITDGIFVLPGKMVKVVRFEEKVILRRQRLFAQY